METCINHFVVQGKDNMKKVSILGDSVSTYTGWNPEGYMVFYENGIPARNGMNSYQDTWWARVLTQIGAEHL